MTNRQRLQRAMRDIERIAADQAISPSPYEHLADALVMLRHASKFALDMRERDGIDKPAVR